MKRLDPILLVEDDFVDALTVQRALKDIEVRNELIHIENGEEALSYLRDTQKPRPCIILLDLNMPRMNGIEFLEEAKMDAQLRSIPIIVLTTSTEHKDRHESFNYSVAGYMVKPIDYENFVEMMKNISNYWSQSEFP
ncbi:MAG: response regulator [Bacteroidota bacterium]